MIRHWCFLLAAIAAVLPGSLNAQQVLERVRVAGFYESYNFKGLDFDRVTEFTIPVGVDLRLGRIGQLALSTGYANIDLRGAGGEPDQSVSGVLDTEVRLGVNVVPGKLIAIATGIIPTGVTTVNREQLAVLGAIASDVIGFSAPTVGSGGGIGGGLAGAVPLGNFALGLGTTVRLPLGYRPISETDDQLKSGMEFRVRAGLEGPLARRTYLRLATVYAARAKDEFGGQTQHGVGHRLVGYLSLSHYVGSVGVTLYGFDVFRGSPQIEPTAVGATQLPKGNLLGAGSRVALPIGQNTEFTPRVEYRVSAQDIEGLGMRRLGRSLRMGADLRQRLSSEFSVVLQGGYVTGDIRVNGSDSDMDGYRAGLHLIVTP